MLGIGEKKDEIKQTLNDMQSVGVDILTIGQYLQPSLNTNQSIAGSLPKNSKNGKRTR